MPTLTTKDLLQMHDSLFAKSRDILTAKNHDYAGGSQGIFANFALCEKANLASAEAGVLIRVLDKLKRLINYLETKHFAVSDEDAEAITTDVINYMVIVHTMLLVRSGSLPPDGDIVPCTPNLGDNNDNAEG